MYNKLLKFDEKEKHYYGNIHKKRTTNKSNNRAKNGDNGNNVVVKKSLNTDLSILPSKIVKLIEELNISKDFFSQKLKYHYPKDKMIKAVNCYSWIVNIKKTIIRYPKAYLTNILNQSLKNKYDYSEYDAYLAKIKYQRKQNEESSIVSNEKLKAFQKQKEDVKINEIQIVQAKNYLNSISDTEKEKIKINAFNFHYQEKTFDTRINIYVMDEKKFRKLFYQRKEQEYIIAYIIKHYKQYF